MYEPEVVSRPLNSLIERVFRTEKFKVEWAKEQANSVEPVKKRAPKWRKKAKKHLKRAKTALKQTKSTVKLSSLKVATFLFGLIRCPLDLSLLLGWRDLILVVCFACLTRGAWLVSPALGWATGAGCLWRLWSMLNDASLALASLRKEAGK